MLVTHPAQSDQQTRSLSNSGAMCTAWGSQGVGGVLQVDLGSQTDEGPSVPVVSGVDLGRSHAGPPLTRGDQPLHIHVIETVLWEFLGAQLSDDGPLELRGDSDNYNLSLNSHVTNWEEQGARAAVTPDMVELWSREGARAHDTPRALREGRSHVQASQEHPSAGSPCAGCPTPSHHEQLRAVINIGAEGAP